MSRGYRRARWVLMLERYTINFSILKTPCFTCDDIITVHAVQITVSMKLLAVTRSHCAHKNEMGLLAECTQKRSGLAHRHHNWISVLFRMYNSENVPDPNWRDNRDKFFSLQPRSSIIVNQSFRRSCKSNRTDCWLPSSYQQCCPLWRCMTRPTSTMWEGPYGPFVMLQSINYKSHDLATF